MKRRISSFRPRARVVAKAVTGSLVLGASSGLASHAAAFDGRLECFQGDFACRSSMNPTFAGRLDRYIDLKIAGVDASAEAFRANGIAIGNSAKAGETRIDTDEGVGHQVAIGPYSSADGLSAVALGARARTSGIGAISVGRYSYSEGAGASAFGAGSFSVGEKSVAMGDTATTGAENAVAVGAYSKSKTPGGVAIGFRASVDSTGKFGSALGRMASVRQAGANSVALGNESIADRPNTVSVGNQKQRRQITNVADGTDDNDAVTVGQLVRKLKMAGCWVE